jgi:hypothetical protein
MLCRVETAGVLVPPRVVVAIACHSLCSEEAGRADFLAKWLADFLADQAPLSDMSLLLSDMSLFDEIPQAKIRTQAFTAEAVPMLCRYPM